MTRIISTFILMALFYVHARKKAVRNTPLLEVFFKASHSGTQKIQEFEAFFPFIYENSKGNLLDCF